MLLILRVMGSKWVRCFKGEEKMSQTKKIKALEALQKEFQVYQQVYQEQQETLKKRKKKIIYLVLTALLAIVLVVLIGMQMLPAGALEKENKAVQSNKRVEEFGEPSAFLTKEQKEDWTEKEVDDSQVFIQFSSELEVLAGSTQLNLQLVNPPYSAYDMVVQVVMQHNSSDILYRSDLLNPGDVLETVELSTMLESGNFPILMQYSFYEEDGETFVGEYEMEADINVH